METLDEKLLALRPDLVRREIPHKGGFGSEAEVTVQVRNFFPGAGGTIVTERNVLTAVRREFNDRIPGTALKRFLLHGICKKLDDYFCSPKVRRYLNAHIPTPYGHIGESEAYLYQWARGMEGFPWEYRTINGVQRIELEEWREFTVAFREAGINMQRDITDPENGALSKNIIHETGVIHDDALDLCWSRIDFGSRSVGVNGRALKEFLEARADNLIRVLARGNEALGVNRYEFLTGAYQHLFANPGTDGKEIKTKYLDYLVRDFRLSALEEPKVAGILLDSVALSK